MAGGRSPPGLLSRSRRHLETSHNHDVYNTIVFGNGDFECHLHSDSSGVVIPSGSHNLIGSTLTCAGNVSEVDPKLGACSSTRPATRRQ